MIVDIKTPLTYLITKGEATHDNFEQKSAEILDSIRVAVDERVSMVQIREKRLPARLLSDLTIAASAVTTGSETRLLLNDRADIAMAAGADGVHLTAESLPADVIRKAFPQEFLIGVSAHSLEAVKAAADAGADFAVFGPVFSTPGKGEPQGSKKLAMICSAMSGFPVLALGGVDESNFLSVLSVGAAGFAAIRALNDADKLISIMQILRRL